METLTAASLSETHESKVLYNQALEMLSRSHIRGAIKHLEEALQISPNNATYLSHYGLCVAIDREDYDAAVKLCERALKIDPKDVVSRVNLGKVYRMQGDNTAAYDEFLRAWKADKSHPAPASELSRMGIRRPPIVPFLSRSHWLNVKLGRLRARLNRGLQGRL
ncbi:MAG: tetratricopeptide repeat protein [Candidatus Krumholzibacteria bacterium]|nr:tetratricopeptide repeat protein [Candidatus Krumholzibacteria bacterium]